MAIRASAASPFAPILSATKTATDVNGGNAAPGDEIMYTVTISNTGPDPATGVNFTDTIDANTTLVPGSLNVSPLAGDDAYTTIGNTRLTVGFTSVGGPSVAIPGQNIFDNDMEFLGDTFTVDTFQNPSAQGGNVDINLINGRLDYVPPVGFTGTDTISYTIKDPAGKTGSATITITVTNMVWYVNNASAAGGDGRSTSPFDTLTPVNGAGGVGDADAPGHFIYVHTGSGNYTTGIGLENTQQLIGEGVALVVSSLTLNPAGSKPTISNGTGNGVTLANGNTVRGLTAQTTAMGGASAGIAGSSVGNLSVDTVMAIGNPGAAVDIQTAGTLAVTFESLSSTDGTRGVRLTSATGGTFTVPGTTTITGTTGDGVTITMGNPTVNFSGGVNITTASGRGIVANAAGTLSTGSSSTVNATGGAALDLQSMNFGTGLNFTSLASTNSSAEGIKINGCIQNITVSGTTNIQTPTGIGIDIQSIFGTSVFSLGNTTVNKTSAGTGVNLNSNGTATVAFSSLNLTAGNGSGLVATSAGTVNVTTGTISATNGPALLVNPTTIGMTFSTVSSSASTTTGISLTSASGSLSIGTTTVTNATGIGINVQGLTNGATASFGTTNVTNPDGDSTGGTGVRLIDNLGNVSFGTLNITPETNQRGLHATNVAASSGSITTTSGTIVTTSQPAVEIDGPAAKTNLNVLLTSVSTNGGPNGIALIDTSGSFTVVGTGTANSGGTIQNTTGADGAQAGNGIFLLNADDVSFDRMLLTSHQNFAIKGTTVNGFEFLNGTINGTNGNNDGADEGCVFFSNLLGTGLINNSTIEGAVEGNIRVINTTGSLNALQITNSTIRNNSVTTGGDGIFARAQSGATMVVKVTGCIMFGHRDDHIQTDAENSGNMITVITGNTLTSNGTIGAPPQASTLGGQITVTGGAAFSSSTSTYNISNNTITGAKPAPITINVVSVTSTAAGLLSGTINNNMLGQAGSANSGSSSSDGISVIVNGASTVNATVTNNQIRQFNNIGIQLIKRDGPGNINATITGNTIAEPVAPNALQGILVTSGATSGPPPDSGTVCVDIGGAGALANAVTGPNFGGDLIRVRQRFSTFVRLPGYAGGATDTAAVETYLIGRNTITNEAPNAKASATTQAPGSFITPGGGACTSGAAPTSLGQEIKPASEESKLVDRDRDSDPSREERTDEVDRTLMATYGKVSRKDGDDEVPKLSREELDNTVRAAVARWTALGISHEELARMEAMTFEVDNLPEHNLAQAKGNTVRIDHTAADYGWFVDPTPFDELEFETFTGKAELQASEYSPAFRRMDLLTVVMRHLGNALDKDNPFRQHRRRGLMLGTIDASVRRLPTDGTDRIGQIKSPGANDNAISLLRPVMPAVLNSSATPAAAAQHNSDVDISQVRSIEGRVLSEARYAALHRRTDQLTTSQQRLTHAGLNTSNANVATSHTSNRAVRVAALTPSGETVSFGPFTLPANKSVTIMFNVTIDNPLPVGVCSISNQGTITADGPISIMTDGDAGMGGAQPTVTTVVTVPTISCPADITTDTDPGVCTATETFMPTVVGCPVPTVVCTIPGPTTITSPFAFPKGVTTVTCTATNTAGSAMCSFTVTVNDNENPTITCPANVTIGTDTGQCSAVVNYTVPSPMDNCPGANVVCSPNTGTAFPKGITTVTCTVTDAGGLTAQCSFTVTVNDDDPPTLTPCPSNITTPASAGQCSATVTYTPPTATDNCPGVGSVSCLPASGTAFIVGTTTVTCSVSDAASNTSMCSFTVTVNDNQNPSITCPANISVTGNVPTVVNYTTPTPTDNCPGATANCLPASGSTFPVGTTTVTCTATDASSNTAQCSFTVSIIPCTLTCPTNITVNNDTGQCSAVVTFSDPTTTGSCGTVTCVPASGSTFNVGTTTVTCTASVGTNCSFTVTVNDNQNPTVTCPANITQGTDSGMCAAIVNYTVPTASDNCPGATVVCSPNTGTSFPTGITTVTCTATDASGNQGSCTFSVTINDDDPPSITCPMPVTQATDAGQCSAVVSYSAPMVSDSCPGVGSPVCTPPSGSAFPKGVTTVGCTVSDAAGNTANCSFTVTVNDMQAPSITCPSPIVTGNTPGQCSAVVTFAPVASDNCPGVGVACSPVSGSTFPKGTTTVNCTATDTSGNQTPCSFTVTVNDTQAPSITCPPTQVAPPGVVNYPAPTFGDNCPGATVVCNPASGSVFPAGFTTVTCTAMDMAGNTAMCSFLVSTFDVAIISDSGGGSIFINTVTGDYQICCGGMLLSGKGTIKKQGCTLTLTHNSGNRRLLLTYDTCQKRGQGVLQMPPGTVFCTIIDSDTRNSVLAPCTP